MKKTAVAVLATIFLAGFVAGGAESQESKDKKPEVKPAAPATPAAPGAPGAPGARPARRDYTDFYAQQLKLTEEQKTKARPVFEEEMKSLADLRTQIRDKKIAADEYRKKSMEIREAANAKIKPILTDEQWEKFNKMRGGGMRVSPGAPPPQAPAK